MSGSDDGVGNISPFVVESPQEAVERCITLLKSCHNSEESWRNVVKGRDADNFCSKVEIFEIRQRATFLCLAGRAISACPGQHESVDLAGLLPGGMHNFE